MITMAVVLSVASLVISHYLVRDLKHEEMVRMNIWAEAMRSFSDADSNADMSLVLKVLNSNATIPVKVLGRDGDVQMLRNMEDEADDLPYSVRIHLSESDWLDVYYDDSLLLR
ncbi:MAG: ATP-binding protein, partial [Bacteroidaceae bacterium]|nr:ATP-binding protein [Bacteroidaceae bacterium]